jgi:TRAP-type C4-dicarboxylate transport system permease small subunit
MMSRSFRQAMDALYVASSVLAGISLVLISAVIPYGVYTRYVLNQAASWPEPMAILLTIVITFFGAATCYRINLHVRVSILVRMLPPPWRGIVEFISEAMLGIVGVFMVVWGKGLVEATWYQSIAEFPFLSVGVTYLPIPVAGAILVLFVIERLTIGQPPETRGAAAHGAAPID